MRVDIYENNSEIFVVLCFLSVMLLETITYGLTICISMSSAHFGQPWYKSYHAHKQSIQHASARSEVLRPNWGRYNQSKIVGNPVVITRDGALRGFTMTTVSGRPISAFQSIPFAQPPVGPLRFKAPVRSKPWNGTRDAIAESPQCVQLDFVQQMQIHGQEDCLYLNVYIPQRPYNPDAKLPVMVFIHGGAFFYGSGSIYGPAYLLDEDVILVTLNYRLGAIGFLSTGDDAASGNAALKDMVLALKWVQQNIGNFRGDANSVTLFGQSSGAGAVHLLMLSPLSRGLFHKAISESGSALCYWSILENAPRTAKQVAEALNCTTRSSQQMIQCLQNVPAESFAALQLTFAEWSLFPLVVFGPTLEHYHSGAFLTEKPEDIYRRGRAAKVPWITGFNTHELSWLVSGMIQDPTTVSDINNDWDTISPILLVLDGNKTKQVWNFYMGNRSFDFETRHNFSNIIGDRYFLECGLEAMRYHSKFTGMPVYGYQFSYPGRYSMVQLVGADPKDWGVAHMDELIYLFNNTLYWETLQQGDPEMQMSRIMTNIWSNFAAYGKPYLTSTRKRLMDIWLPIEPSTSRFSPLRFLDLNLHSKMIDDPWVERYNFWRRISPNP